MDAGYNNLASIIVCFYSIIKVQDKCLVLYNHGPPLVLFCCL
jgi:hypothetical protein